MFNTLPHVQSIDVRQNQVNMIITFKFLKREFQISTIDDYAFSRLKVLQKLDLSGNKLETVPPNVFFDTFEKSTQSVLKVLYLYGKSIFPLYCLEGKSFR